MDNHYEEIKKVKGTEELCTLISKWDRLAINLDGRTYGSPILLPDIIMYTEKGFGNSYILRLLADYLDSKKVLMDFSGDVKLFEFALNYCPPDQPFTELGRLIDSLRVVAGYRNEYKGLLRIDLDQWVGHHSEKYFFELLEYLASHTGDWMIILTISKKTEEKSKKLEATVSMFLRTEVIHIGSIDSKGFAEYAAEYIKQFGISFDSSAMELLDKSIEKLSKIKHFHSHRTIDMLCNDIVYHVLSESETPKTVLSADDLSDFSVESDYIKKTEIKSAKQNNLGFRIE